MEQTNAMYCTNNAVGDLPPCIYLPKHIDKKIPVESAWLLDKFMKETLDMASSGKPVGVLPLGMSPQLHE